MQQILEIKKDFALAKNPEMLKILKCPTKMFNR